MSSAFPPPLCWKALVSSSRGRHCAGAERWRAATPLMRPPCAAPCPTPAGMLGLFNATHWALLAEADALERAQELTGGGGRLGHWCMLQPAAQLPCVGRAVMHQRCWPWPAPAEIGALAARGLHQQVLFGRKHFSEHAVGCLGCRYSFTSAVGEPGGCSSAFFCCAAGCVQACGCMQRRTTQLPAVCIPATWPSSHHCRCGRWNGGGGPALRPVCQAQPGALRPAAGAACGGAGQPSAGGGLAAECTASFCQPPRHLVLQCVPAAAGAQRRRRPAAAIL